jgi:hypothetical protein
MTARNQEEDHNADRPHVRLELELFVEVPEMLDLLGRCIGKSAHYIGRYLISLSLSHWRAKVQRISKIYKFDEAFLQTFGVEEALKHNVFWLEIPMQDLVMV